MGVQSDIHTRTKFTRMLHNIGNMIVNLLELVLLAVGVDLSKINMGNEYTYQLAGQ